MTTEAVFQILKTHHRPYSVNEIIGHLPKEIPKGNVQHALTALENLGKIFMKLNGKQKIYCIIQDSTKDVQELIRLDRELHAHAAKLDEKRQELEKEIQSRESILQALKSGPTLDEAIQERDSVKARLTELTAHVQRLREASGRNDSTENINEVRARSDSNMRAYAKRKRLCNDILEAISEGYPGSKKELYQDIGIEDKIIK